MSGRSDERPPGKSREPAAQRAASGSAVVAGVGTFELVGEAVEVVGEPLVVEGQITTAPLAGAAAVGGAGTFIAPGGAGGVIGAGARQVAHEAEQSMLRDIDAILARIESGLASERAAMDALLKRVTRTAA